MCLVLGSLCRQRRYMLRPAVLEIQEGPEGMHKEHAEPGWYRTGIQGSFCPVQFVHRQRHSPVRLVRVADGFNVVKVAHTTGIFCVDNSLIGLECER